VAFAVFAAVRGHEGVELHGGRLQRAGREGRSVGYRCLFATQDTAPHPRASAQGGVVASEMENRAREWPGCHRVGPCWGAHA
jgi:hypothetical protein